MSLATMASPAAFGRPDRRPYRRKRREIDQLRRLPIPDPVPPEIDANPAIRGGLKNTACKLYRFTGGKPFLWSSNGKFDDHFGIPRRTCQRHIAKLEAFRIVRRFGSMEEFREWFDRVGRPVYALAWPADLVSASRILVVLSMLPRPAGCALEEHRGGPGPEAQTGPPPAPEWHPPRRRNGTPPSAKMAPPSLKASKSESSNLERAGQSDDSAHASGGRGDPIGETSGGSAVKPAPAAPGPDPAAALEARWRGLEESERAAIRAEVAAANPLLRKWPKMLDPLCLAALEARPVASPAVPVAATEARPVAEPTVPVAPSAMTVRRPSDHVRNLPADPDPARPAEVARIIGGLKRVADLKSRTLDLWSEAFRLVQAGGLSAELIADLVDNATRPGARKPAHLLSKSLARELRCMRRRAPKSQGAEAEGRSDPGRPAVETNRPGSSKQVSSTS